LGGGKQEAPTLAIQKQANILIEFLFFGFKNFYKKSLSMSTTEMSTTEMSTTD